MWVTKQLAESGLQNLVCLKSKHKQTNKRNKQTNNHVQKNITEAIPPFAPLQGKVKEQAVAVDVTVTFTLFTYR